MKNMENEQEKEGKKVGEEERTREPHPQPLSEWRGE